MKWDRTWIMAWTVEQWQTWNVEQSKGKSIGHGGMVDLDLGAMAGLNHKGGPGL